MRHYPERAARKSWLEIPRARVSPLDSPANPGVKERTSATIKPWKTVAEGLEFEEKGRNHDNREPFLTCTIETRRRAWRKDKRSRQLITISTAATSKWKADKYRLNQWLSHKANTPSQGDKTSPSIYHRRREIVTETVFEPEHREPEFSPQSEQAFSVTEQRNDKMTGRGLTKVGRMWRGPAGVGVTFPENLNQITRRVPALKSNLKNRPDAGFLSGIFLLNGGRPSRIHLSCKCIRSNKLFVFYNLFRIVYWE